MTSLKLRDKHLFYVFNGMQPIERPIEHSFVQKKEEKLKNILLNVYEELKMRHYDVGGLDVEIFISNSFDSKTAKEYSVYSIKYESEETSFYVAFSEHNSYVYFNGIKMSYDYDSRKKCICVYSGNDWSKDKKLFISSVNLKNKQSICEIYYDNSQKYEKYLKIITEKIEKFFDDIFKNIPKRESIFEFNLPQKQIICDNFGMYVLFFSEEQILEFLKRKKGLIGDFYIRNGGTRLVSYSINIPSDVNKIVQDGFMYALIKDYEGDLNGEIKNDSYCYNSEKKYPVIFEPKDWNGLYIVDMSLQDPIERAKTFVKIGDYLNNYKNPQLLIHRDIFEDEIKIYIPYFKERAKYLEENIKHYNYSGAEHEFCKKFLKCEKEYVEI